MKKDNFENIDQKTLELYKNIVKKELNLDYWPHIEFRIWYSHTLINRIFRYNDN
jgi:hypothetical protein